MRTVTRTWRLSVVQEESLGDCRRCGLCQSRTNIVFGDGSGEAPLMFVGEAPGADEDARGLPFVGRAGKLLDKIIEAMGYRRELVYIANVLKCRPPENRNPSPEEVASCLPFLREQIAVVRPAVIVTLGNVATKSLLGVTDGIMKLRGTWRSITVDGEEIPVMPTFHPSFLLREPTAKAVVWRDMKAVLVRLSEVGHRPPFETWKPKALAQGKGK